MKRSEFLTELHAPSLSSEAAGVRIFCDREGKPGVRWVSAAGEVLWDTDFPELFWKLKFFSNRSTGLSLSENGEASVSTLEHLAPVLLLYPNVRFEIRALSPELPIFDGSAYPWFETVRRLAGLPQPLVFYDVPLRERFEIPGGFVEVCPAETLEVEYSLSHGEFSDSAFLAVYDAEDLVKVFPARTFIFKDDFLKARAAGLLSAVTRQSGMLLSAEKGRAKVLSGGEFRMPGEPAFHKILDLLGDISLPAPFLPRLRVRIHNGGHVAHRKLLERLKDYAPRYASQIEQERRPV